MASAKRPALPKAAPTKPIAKKKKPRAATKPKLEPLPDAPKPWRSFRPAGLFTMLGAVSVATAAVAWNFFLTVTWFQRFPRFPKTAHFNGYHCMMTDHLEIHNLVTEAIHSAMMMDPHPKVQIMLDHPERVSVAVMRHMPDWGLGAHVDNIADDGFVLGIALSNCKKVPRMFRWANAVFGLEWEIDTPHRSIFTFSGQVYTIFTHSSVKNPKQDGECVSLTVRLKDDDGYYQAGEFKTKSTRFATGAPAAMRNAHAIMRPMVARGEIPEGRFM